MDDNEFRKYLEQKDAETREDRVNRRKRLPSIRFGWYLPELLWEYSSPADQLYIDGQFGAVIIWSATLLELILADKLIAGGKGTKELVELLSLAEKTRLCTDFEIITKKDRKSIDKIRELRNAIAHANVGKLDQRGKRHYPDLEEASKVRPHLYLADLGGPLEEDALYSLTYTMSLVEKWYGEKPSD